MKILVLSDVECKAIWDYYKPGKLDGYDVIVSCGDLHPHYLSFLATFFHGPVLYVHGNHDDRYEKTPPEGCVCIEDMIYEYRGVRFLGLGGSMRYHPGGCQYTERQMNARIRRLWFSLQRHGGFDVLVAHAPARGLGDYDNVVHTGFTGFRRLMERYRPALFLHGHVHLNYSMGAKRVSYFGPTAIVNAYERYVVDMEPENGEFSLSFHLC